MAPVKRLTRKEVGLHQRPWINHDILASMSDRDKLYKAFLNEKDPTIRATFHKTYKLKRNSVTSQLRKAKKHYFNLFFEENQNNVKQTWKGIRNLINVSKKSSTNIRKIVDNGKEITDPKEMADIINNFYVNIGRTIDKKIPNIHKPFSNDLPDRNIYDIVLNPCSRNEVKQYISDLTVSKASGPNSLPTSILKEFVDELVEPVTIIL